MAFVSTQVARKTLGVHENTLRRWAKAGLIRCYRASEAGHRHYDVDEFVERQRKRDATARHPAA